MEKVLGVTKNKLGGQIVKKFVGLRPKTYSYLKDKNDKDGKGKSTKKCVLKRKLKFQGYKNCSEAAQIENKTIHLDENIINIDSLKKDKKEFIQNNKLVLKAQQRLRSERHNVFTEEVNKIALRSNDDKRMESIDLIKTYASGMNKNLVRKKG